MRIYLYLFGYDMICSKNLKEINMDNSHFRVFKNSDKDKIADLNNHQDIFMFHRCCMALEHASIKNMNYYPYIYG